MSDLRCLLFNEVLLVNTVVESGPVEMPRVH